MCAETEYLQPQKINRLPDLFSVEVLKGIT
ncbi:Uncharacterised protein [Vibrio cholerae]|nr:Uncharacterised protein [Vibrio cholerae]